MTFIKGDRGSALIAVVIISLLLLGVTMGFVQWSWTHTKEATHSLGVQNALTYAESGIQAAQQYVRMPGTVISTSPYVGSEEKPRGRLEYSVVVPASSPQRGLEAYATGYYYTAQGGFEDPATHQRCQIAVIRAVLGNAPIDKALIAVPGELKINPGSTLGGLVYADDVVFVSGPDTTPPARVRKVVYGSSIKRGDGTPDPHPGYVVFGDTPEPVGYPVTYPLLTSGIRAFYRNLATSATSLLRDGDSLDGMVPAPSTAPVYFCDGDLHVGQQLPVMPTGRIIVYVTGKLTIHGLIDLRGPNWIVFLVEKDIEIDDTTADNFALNGTFITNGKIASKQLHHSGNLAVTGSLIAGEGIDLASGWDNGRSYSYRRAFTTVPLPRLTQLVDYTVLQGKYQQ